MKKIFKSLVPSGEKTAPKKRLEQVFGIMSEVPQYNYVDRGNLDANFKRGLRGPNHIVIYGASKQGKTCLRKKNLNDNKHIHINCVRGAEIDSLYSALLKEAGITHIPTAHSTTQTSNKSISGGISTGIGKLGSKIEAGNNLKIDARTVGHEINNPPYIAKCLKEQGKNLIILDDVHYLSDCAQKQLSFDLKTFWEEGIKFIILGVYPAQNALPFNNPELQGRLNIIDIRWSDDDLEEVISLGESALNIKIDSKLKRDIVRNSFNSVGLLQRLVSKYCEKEGILDEQENLRVLNNADALNEAYKAVCVEIETTYSQVTESFSKGKKRGKAKYPTYMRILQALVEVGDHTKLTAGIAQSLIFERIQKIVAKVSDETTHPSYIACLGQLNSFKVNSFLYYDSLNGKLVVHDPNFFFFCAHSNYDWPWNEHDLPLFRATSKKT